MMQPVSMPDETWNLGMGFAAALAMALVWHLGVLRRAATLMKDTSSVNNSDVIFESAI